MLRRSHRRAVWGGTVVALLAIGAAWTLAASIAVQLGVTENGAGTFHPTAFLTYFAEARTGVTIITNAALAVLSPAVGTPTVLAGASASYGLNALTAGDATQYWVYTESTSAPVNTEIELEFWVSTGVVPTVTQLTLYIETQAVAPGSALTFTLYYDLGSPASGTITLNSAMVLAQQCPALGTCF
ncbi:MAG TPA: hypothetical protein VEH57_08440 [Thermoplasmata archaeon]|nr:hypothetical protein [Thermoplasmata archaeon]